MPITPTSSLIQALSYPARPAGAEPPESPAAKLDAARAAARAAFQAAAGQQGSKPAADSTAPKPVDPTPVTENGRIRPRGSVINIIV
jgi:hypothetical protein